MKGVFTVFATFVACIVLAGCNTTAGSGNRRVETKAVIAGGTIELNVYRTIEVDCTPNTLPRIKVIKQPAFGRVSISQTTSFPAFGQDNVRSKCNNRRVPSIAVNYTSNGQSGLSDRVVFEIIWHDGELWSADYTVLVR
jgi:hypothetical protein